MATEGNVPVEIIDCHTHTYLSGHGEGTALDVANAASKLGITTLALTEHLIMPDGFDPTYGDSMSPDEVVVYRHDVETAQAEHPEIEILYGAEADWLDDEDFLLENTKGYEYLLGSVHYIDGWGFDNPAYMEGWDERGVDDVWARYAEIWCEAVESKVPFTTMAHPDLPKVFGYMPSTGFDLRGMYADMAATAARRGVAVEVNTCGWAKPMNEQYPSSQLLKAFKQAGVDCTIGSDAHRPADVGYGFERAVGIMYEAGYRRIMVPTASGDRRYIQLS